MRVDTPAGADTASLLRLVDRHLRDSGEAACTFGRRVLGDPRFVADLRGGRVPRAATATRVIAAISGQDV